MIILTLLTKLIEFFIRVFIFIFFYLPIFAVTIIMDKCGASDKQIVKFLDFFFDRDWQSLKVKINTLWQRLLLAFLRVRS